MVAGVWTPDEFLNLKNFRTQIRIQNFWNRSGVGVWKSHSGHLCDEATALHQVHALVAKA